MTSCIQETVGFALAQACKSHRYHMDAALRAHHLRVGQEMILLQLWTHDGLTQSDLADLVCVEPPTISKMLHRMEAEGLVERRADDDDGRVSRVFLSASSRTIEQAVAQSWAAVEQRATAGMTVEERMLLRRLLLQLRENLG